ncbi:hypothetical protein ACIGBL_34395 [Streptomyces sp. NPDC085614]|uniref:hypothetical protein n=1 Tax=Streptomyces sp. NPDC085614 TaxID=3365733 RepID=UPI0037D7F149
MPLIDAILRSEILIKGAVVHERLVADYGFTGTYQRLKFYMQEARPRIVVPGAAHFGGVPMSIVYDRTETVVRRQHVAPGEVGASMCRPPTGPPGEAGSNVRS